jgi:2-oxo-4-hydroxy-4-carboxy-5-ureidoimidazoline decarboxylase
MREKLTSRELKGLPLSEFVRIIGSVFEHSAWIAEATFPKGPFEGIRELHLALCQTVRDADGERQLTLIRAHPDLVGRAATTGALTEASTAEQASAGLDRLTEDEVAAFRKFNQEYRDKFDFPFVICARLNKKEAILEGFRIRLRHSREAEIGAALEEIYKIARLRLLDIVEGS